jgi:hypothetical protein
VQIWHFFLTKPHPARDKVTVARHTTQKKRAPGGMPEARVLSGIGQLLVLS